MSRGSRKTGANISRLKAGDAIYGYALFAAAAPSTRSCRMAKPPLNRRLLLCIEAAAVPLAALTAWQALIDVAQLSAGQTVLVHGGSGGVGSFAVQIAKASGAKVIATAF